MLLRWGILSTGLISRDFCIAFSALPKSEHVLKAVAARNIDSAKDFAQEFDIPKHFGSYLQLVQDPEVDIVYIGTVTSSHFEVAKLSLQNGKHVLCEKPLCINVKQTEELIGLAKSKGLFLMEAIWSRHFPSYTKLKELLDSGIIGDPMHVIVPFGFHHSLGYKVKERVLGSGTLLDLGIYGVQLASLVFKGETPLDIKAVGVLNDDGADVSTSASLLYSKGRIATLMTQNQATLANEAVIVGSKGAIKIPNFWAAIKLETPMETLEFPLPVTAKKPALPHSEGLSYQCQEIHRCLTQDLTESPNLPLAETLTIANILETIRKQIGVTYPADTS